MKILLSLILCSGVSGTCLPPYDWPKQFPDMYVKFTCGAVETI